MKNVFLKLAAAALFALPLVLTSCKGDGEKNPEPTLSIDFQGETITFRADGTSEHDVITVTTNQKKWACTMTPEDGNGWLTIDQNDDKLSLAATKNEATTDRIDVKLTFTAGKATPIVLTVKQLGDEILFQVDAPEQIVFEADGTGGQAVIEVECDYGSWDFTQDPTTSDWLTAKKVDDTVELSALVNTKTSEPTPVKLTFTGTDDRGTSTPIVITVMQKAYVPTAYYYQVPNIPITATAFSVSANGRYMAGVTSNFLGATSYIFDLDEIENTTYTPATSSVNSKSVDNNGVGHNGFFTADGTTTVYGSGWESKPKVGTDEATAAELPYPGTYNGKTFGSGEGQLATPLPTYISADGSVILGEIADYTVGTTSARMAVQWTKSGSDYVFAGIAADQIKSDGYSPWIARGVTQGLSTNGAYAAGVIRNDSAESTATPCIYNLSTNEATLVSGHTNGVGTAASDDGILFFTEPYFAQIVPQFGTGVTDASKVYVFDNGTTNSFADWANAKFPELKDNSDFQDAAKNAGAVMGVSADNTVILWISGTKNDFKSHVIIMR